MDGLQDGTQMVDEGAAQVGSGGATKALLPDHDNDIEKYV